MSSFLSFTDLFLPRAVAQQPAESGSFFPNGDVGESFSPPSGPVPSYMPHTKAQPPEKITLPPLRVPSTIKPAPTPAPTPVTTQTHEQFVAERLKLQLTFQQEVPASLSLPTDLTQHWTTLALNQLQQNHYDLNKNQAILVVDRNPHVQKMAIMVINAEKKTLDTIGATSVSTGTKGRKHYYITPTGLFMNTADRLGYRAQGTKNQHGIMDNGTHGMRVWDFGWQTAKKGWLHKTELGPIRLEMHATDPKFLEQRLGHTASAGCIRIPASMNVFLDKHGLLDADYEQRSKTDKRFLALLRPDRTPSPLAGVAVIVVDTSLPTQASKPDNTPL